MKPYVARVFFLVVLSAHSVPDAVAQVPDTLKHGIYGGSNGDFGAAVAMSGTYVVVGAHTENGWIGKAYVYDLASATPTVPMVTLSNPDPRAFDRFGYSVSISGPLIVVGGDAAYAVTNWRGFAHVYDLRSATPATPVYSLANPGTDYDRFGYSVGISGKKVVVGAPSYKNPPNSYEGRLCVYDLSSAAPATPVLAIPRPDIPGDKTNYAQFVAISGDRVLAMGPSHSAVFNLASQTPSAPMTLLTYVAGPIAAVSASRVAVGYLPFYANGPDPGCARVYRVTGALSYFSNYEEVVYEANAPAPINSLGMAVSLSEARLIVSHYGADLSSGASGELQVHDLASATPGIPVATLYNATPHIADRFGYAVAHEGNTLVVGTPGDDTTGTNYGAVYVYGPASNDTDGDGLLDLWEFARFGTIAGHSALDDSDGDGRTDLIEQAFNTNPLVPDGSALFPVASENGYLTATITKRAGVNYLVQSGATLDANAFSAASTTVLLDNATTLKVRDNVLSSTPGSRFMRVKVTAAP